MYTLLEILIITIYHKNININVIKKHYKEYYDEFVE